MTNQLYNVSMNGRMAYVIMCVEAYLVNKYHEKDWTIISKLMWKATSMNWADWSDLYSTIIPDVFLQYEQYSAADMGKALSNQEFNTVKELYDGITDGCEDDPGDELNIILNKPFDMAMVYEGTVIGDGKESVKIIRKTEQILKNNGIALPDYSKVLFSSIEERNGWGNDFYGEYLSIVLSKEPDLSSLTTKRGKCSISFLNTNLNLDVVNEDYFALKVVNDTSVESTKHVGFYYRDTDLLEFSVDSKTNKIKKFLLVLCNHFEVLNEDLPASTIPETGCLSINLPQHNECNTFIVRVYKNAVDIRLSNLSVQHAVKSGQVIFGLSVDNDLVSVTVVDMTEQEVSHTIDELNYGIA